MGRLKRRHELRDAERRIRKCPVYHDIGSAMRRGSREDGEATYRWRIRGECECLCDHDCKRANCSSVEPEQRSGCIGDAMDIRDRVRVKRILRWPLMWKSTHERQVDELNRRINLLMQQILIERAKSERYMGVC